MFLCTHCPLVPLYLFIQCSSVPRVPLLLWTRYSSVPLYPLFLSTHCSSLPSVPLLLCTHCSSIATAPIFLCTHCSSVPSVPLFLGTHCTYVPLYPVFLYSHCSQWSSVPTVPLFLRSSFPLNPLSLCSYCSSLPTVPLYLCTTDFLLLPLVWSTGPLILSSYCSSDCTYLVALWGDYTLMFNYLGARHVRDNPQFGANYIPMISFHSQTPHVQGHFEIWKQVFTSQPRREKRESCITCRRMLGTTPFFSPKTGGKTVFGKRFLIWAIHASRYR